MCNLHDTWLSKWTAIVSQQQPLNLLAVLIIISKACDWRNSEIEWHEKCYSTVKILQICNSQLVRKFPGFFTSQSPQKTATFPSPQSCFLKFHFHVILSTTRGSSKRFISYSFPQHNPVFNSLLRHPCYMSRPTHLAWFHHIWRRMQFNSTSFCSFHPLFITSRYYPRHPTLHYPQSMFFTQCQRLSLIPTQNNTQDYS